MINSIVDNLDNNINLYYKVAIGSCLYIASI